MFSENDQNCHLSGKIEDKTKSLYRIKTEAKQIKRIDAYWLALAPVIRYLLNDSVKSAWKAPPRFFQLGGATQTLLTESYRRFRVNRARTGNH